MPQNDDLPEGVKWLCHDCIGEAYLKSEVRRVGKVANCSYCRKRLKSYSILEMADRVEAAFEQHFVPTSTHPTPWQYAMLADKESNYDWERDGEPVLWAIANAAEIPEDAASDIQSILEDRHEDIEAAQMGEETPFSSDTYYEEKGVSDHEWQEDWRDFELSLKTQARFFSRTAAANLFSVFDGIEKMSAHDGRPLVVDAGPGTAMASLFRARVFQSDEKLKEALCRPDLHLGSPPAALANAGRMNARGISVFYGANDLGAAIAEVRPPVGSQVLVARFNIDRPLRLLDLSALGAVAEKGSIFDPSWAARLERATFLRSLSQRITRPVMPDDENMEYLPTQAIADYLATEHQPSLDGIIYPSIQIGGNAHNVVLFHHAARVEAFEVPDGTEIAASLAEHTEEGWSRNYFVTEQVPTEEHPSEEEQDALLFPYVAPMEEWDAREATLRIDMDSVAVHVVKAVNFKCEEYGVLRHRWKKTDDTF